MNQQAELREFIREKDVQVFNFCYLLLLGSPAIEKVVVDTFREFGDEFRKALRHGEKFRETVDGKIKLMQIAWRRARRDSAPGMWVWVPGRDTRALKAFERDALAEWVKGGWDSVEKKRVVCERLARVDFDLRAALILRDILGFDDEEIVRILGLRWGVYRHRIHRARLEYKDSLRGRSLSLPLPQNLVPFPAGKKA